MILSYINALYSNRMIFLLDDIQKLSYFCNWNRLCLSRAEAFQHIKTAVNPSVGNQLALRPARSDDAVCMALFFVFVFFFSKWPSASRLTCAWITISHFQNCSFFFALFLYLPFFEDSLFYAKGSDVCLNDVWRANVSDAEQQAVPKSTRSCL